MSLEWLMFNTGEMLRSSDCDTDEINFGERYSGADVARENSTLIKNSYKVNVGSFSGNKDFLKVILEKERLISAKDDIITERDKTITSLQELLLRR